MNGFEASLYIFPCRKGCFDLILSIVCKDISGIPCCLNLDTRRRCEVRFSVRNKYCERPIYHKS